MSNKMALDALTAIQDAIGMATSGDSSDFVWPKSTMRHPGETAYGWICEKHGLGYQSGCICCAGDLMAYREQKDREARYAREDAIRDASKKVRAAIAALQAEPQSQINTMRLDAPILDGFPIPVYWEYLHDGRWRPELYFNGKYAKGARGLYSDLQMHAMAQASARYLLAVDEFDHACHVDGDTPGGAPEQYDEAEGRLKAARAVLESAIKGFSA